VNQALVIDATGAQLDGFLEKRLRAGERFFTERAAQVARLCHQMAERFARGGRLLAVGHSPSARSDARHVAVEFVHPVIVGKRALPALALSAEAARVALVVGPEDIVIAFGAEEDAGEARRTIAAARDRGCLTIAFAPAGAEWELEPPTEEPDVRQELVETLYHVLWELVHVFFEHRGLLEGRSVRRQHDAGASSFLYPFLAEREHDLDGVLEDVRESVLMKAQEVGELRTQTLHENRETLVAAAQATQACFGRGGHVLALGNGGSATDAMDLVADLGSATMGRPRPALDLSEDPGIITAIANDIGTEAIFARQVIPYGRAGDVLVALSTSGNSTNVIAALEQARQQRVATVAFVGYDGGRVASEGLADHVVVTRSQHIPRIQEAQATGYHLLRRLVG
jgi:D-sedoheptulose 7-phosphate isomerase